MQTSRLLSYSPNSPSFDSFSSALDIAAIAARVVEELRDQDQQFNFHGGDDDDNFEFDCPSRTSFHPVASADEIFYDGKIRPSNPYGGGAENALVSPPKSSTLPRRRRPALRKLMSEERDTTSDSSSEAEEDLNGVPPETYCLWTPKGGDEKSSSVGLSKRWKLRSLLYARSSSEGNGEEEEPSSKVVGEVSEETKRRTFVPFNKDMMGILKNVNGLSRHLRPF
ncbi:hypothetical protein Rs2_43541 [Raphanus sativus]|uniref:Uncharacterized protein LOC108825712 n=1 Tax=Raphanus sativus TaxID=3726 RepID=A0A6J0L3U3_RAPSA|nr:uncharacterized protein LOC108825712 [Raphanus sativus]KAJ4878523.1 hypothetical protein Rs2_43541 [Raphanus sativus]